MDWRRMCRLQNSMEEYLEHSLNFPDMAAWTVQGFGLLRCYPFRETKDVRLHIWNSDLRIEHVSDIHTHPWDFTSHIICGYIHNHLYEEQKAPARQPPPTPEWSSMTRYHIVTGEGAAALEDEAVPMFVLHKQTKTYSASSRYNQHWQDIHRTEASDGTVTVIERTQRDESGRAYSYAEGLWISAAPRPANETEILGTITKALRMMEKQDD